ncbi:MAG: DUF3592 domain-containing protein [Candidatus Abawacabacteria bacterium]|nr:DUF3592 domain-containing protein [Candidatus Abawacabacteria bacterium]
MKTWWLKALIILGSIGILISIGCYVHTQLFLLGAVHTEGKVVAVDLQFDGSGDPTYVPTVQFQDALGVTRTFQPFTSYDASEYETNDIVKVAYDLSYPEKAVLLSWGELYLIPFLLAMVSVMCVGFSLLFSFFLKQESSRKNH